MPLQWEPGRVYFKQFSLLRLMGLREKYYYRSLVVQFFGDVLNSFIKLSS
jgi:hypothetical protein